MNDRHSEQAPDPRLGSATEPKLDNWLANGIYNMRRFDPTPDEHSTRVAGEIQDDLTKIGLGQEGASLRLLSEVRQFAREDRFGYPDRYSANLDDVTQKLEADGKTKVSVEKQDGQIQALHFTDLTTNKTVDVDLRTGTINGETVDKQRQDAAKQASEYYQARLDDERFGRKSDRPSADQPPISEEGRQKASDLLKAVFDGDSAKLTDLAKEILNDPVLEGNARPALEQLLGPVSIGKNDAGEPVLNISMDGYHRDSLQIDGSGNATTADYSFRGDTPWGQPPARTDVSLPEVMETASQNALVWASGRINDAQGFLKYQDNLPADGYINMPALVDTVYDRKLTGLF